MNHTDDDDDRKKYIEDYVKEADISAVPRFVSLLWLFTCNCAPKLLKRSNFLKNKLFFSQFSLAMLKRKLHNQKLFVDRELVACVYLELEICNEFASVIAYSLFVKIKLHYYNGFIILELKKNACRTVCIDLYTYTCFLDMLHLH